MLKIILIIVIVLAFALIIYSLFMALNRRSDFRERGGFMLVAATGLIAVIGAIKLLLKNRE